MKYTIKMTLMSLHIHRKPHSNQFKHSSSIKDTTSTVREAIVLVLLMKGIFYVCN
jgi:hypothetical protein